MRLKALLLALLLIAPTASRVAASGQSTPTPDPAPQAKSEPTQPKVKEKKKIVVVSPEKEIVVDDDGVFMSGEGWDDPEMFADLGELGELPELSWFEGGGYIGIRPLEMTPELRTHFGAPKEAGVFVGTIEKDSPAAKAGLQVGDIVTSADGEKVDRKRDLVRTIRRKKEGDTVKIELVRDRATKTLTVTVVEREDSRIRVGDFGPGMRRFQMRHPRDHSASPASAAGSAGLAGLPGTAGRSREAAGCARGPGSPETKLLASGSGLFKTFLRAAGDPAARLFGAGHLRRRDLLHARGALRVSPQGARNAYRVPGYRWVPLLFGATALAIVANTLVETPRESLLGLAFIGLGIPIYWIQRALKRRATSSHESRERDGNVSAMLSSRARSSKVATDRVPVQP